MSTAIRHVSESKSTIAFNYHAQLILLSNKTISVRWKNKFKVYLERVHKWRVVKILLMHRSHCHGNSLSWTGPIGRGEREEKNN